MLKASHELHVRWVGESVYETRAPLVARLSPGLHFFYTPLREGGDSYVDLYARGEEMLIVFD